MGATPQNVAWARLFAAARPFARPMPRHGAWYPVVEEHGERLVLEIEGRRVAIAANLLEVRERKPLRFTVVRRPLGAQNPQEGTPEDLGRVYAVCPACDGRTRIWGEPVTIECEKCRHVGEVAWWETG